MSIINYQFLITILFSFLLTFAVGADAQTQQVKVLEYHPAPGQFVNLMPNAGKGTTHEDICSKCEESINGGGIVHLGTFGGYLTVQFDHAVKNLRGSDLRIKGNASYATGIGGSIEPGIVYVGVGESEETAKWYELAGSEYYTSEIHDFSITYHKPIAEEGEHSLMASTYDDYIRWEASWTENGVRRDSVGYHNKNSFHTQTYWPYWEQGETMTFHGGKLPNNAAELSGNGSYWVLYRYASDAYGYVDAALNTEDYSTFDIDWAVDEQGNHVDLSEVNFIRVQCAIFQHCGWIGETSTEVGEFTDLHLLDGYDDNPIVIMPQQSTSVDHAPQNPILHPQHSTLSTPHSTYSLTGQKVSDQYSGIVIKGGKKVLERRGN